MDTPLPVSRGLGLPGRRRAPSHCKGSEEEKGATFGKPGNGACFAGAEVLGDSDGTVSARVSRPGFDLRDEELLLAPKWALLPAPPPYIPNTAGEGGAVRAPTVPRRTRRGLPTLALSAPPAPASPALPP